jgi:hypothetical protein
MRFDRIRAMPLSGIPWRQEHRSARPQKRFERIKAPQSRAVLVCASAPVLQDKIRRSVNFFGHLARKYRRLDRDHFPGLEGHRKLASYEVAGKPQEKSAASREGRWIRLALWFSGVLSGQHHFHAASRHFVPG